MDSQHNSQSIESLENQNDTSASYATNEANIAREETLTVEELLISCIQARPPLWDSRLPVKERSKTIRDQLWLEIFHEFGDNPEFSLEFLMKKWRNLRVTYVRIKGEYIPSGSSCKKKKKWEFFDEMSFLQDTIEYRATITNIPSQISPVTTSSLSPILPNVPKVEQKKEKIEVAIVDALNKINNSPIPSLLPETTMVVNPICSRISELLTQIPQRERTLLEIKLLQIAYEGTKDFF